MVYSFMKNKMELNLENKCTFTLEERHNIIEKFPNHLREYLIDLENPLDEVQVLISLFKDKNVRIIILDTFDEFGEQDKMLYFHLGDIGKVINPQVPKDEPRNINFAFGKINISARTTNK